MSTTLFAPGSVFRNDSGKWRIRWWIALAMIVSVGLHYALYEFMQTGVFNRMFQHVMVDPKTVPKPKRERLRINPELLKNQTAITDVKDPAPGIDTSRLDPPKGTPDELTSKIRFAPAAGENLKAAFNSFSAGSSAKPDSFELPDTAASDLSTELNSLNKAALKTSISDKQLQMDAGGGPNPSEKSMLDGNELTRLNKDTLSGKGDSVKVPGFSSLDEVLGAGGGIGQGGGPILMPTDLLFSYDKAELAPAARGSMMKLGAIIQKNLNKHFVIEGHTDTFGGDDYNNNLSLRRAEAVKEWLVETLKIDAGLISTEGHGKKNPIVNPRGSVEQQGLNRRVEIRTE